MTLKERRSRYFFNWESVQTSSHYPVQTQSSYDWTGFWDQVTSVSNKFYKQQILRCENATTGRTGTQWFVKSTPWKVSEVPRDRSGVWIETHTSGNRIPVSGVNVLGIMDGAFPTLSSSQLESAKALCGVSIRNAIRGAQTTFQSAVFAAELKKTVGTVGSLGHQLVTGLKGWRKKMINIIKTNKTRKWNRDADAEKLKIITDSWLTYQYGIKPLLADIDNGMQTIANLLYRPLGTPVSGFGESTMLSQQLTVQGVPGIRTMPYAFYGAIKETVECRSAAFCKLDSFGTVESASRSLGGHFEEFVPSLYELVPYSFLMDYFSNLGDVLSAMCTNTYDLGWSWYTVLRTTVLSGGLVSSRSWGPDYTYSCEGGEFEFKRKIFSRSPGIPIPNWGALRVEIPNFAQGVNTLILAISKLNQ